MRVKLPLVGAVLLLLVFGLAEVRADAPSVDRSDDVPVPLDIPLDRIPNYREYMRAIVEGLSDYARARDRNVIILVRGGLELFIKGEREFQLEEMKDPDGVEKHRRLPLGTPMRRYIRSVDGLVIDNRYCGAALAEDKPKDKDKDKLKDKAKPAPPANSLLAEAEAAKAKAERERVEARRTYKDRLIAKVRDQGVRLLSIERCKTADQAANAMSRAGRDGVLTFADAESGGRFDRLPSGRPSSENPGSVDSLQTVRNMAVMLDSRQFARRDEWIVALTRSNHDLLFIDGFHKGNESLTREEVYDLKFKRMGPRRLVLARINVSEAQDNRYYWKKEWLVGDPGWLDAPSRRDPAATVVQYWSDDWKKIIGQYFKGLMDLGFDGVVLEGVEAYEHFEKMTPLE
ncbi:MAG: hypothetical protein H7840_11085 [Alphaproteobacteria bacterium]